MNLYTISMWKQSTGGVGDEGEAGPGAGLHHLLDAGADGVREVPDHGEDGEAAENARARVEQRDQHRVPARDKHEHCKRQRQPWCARAPRARWVHWVQYADGLTETKTETGAVRSRTSTVHERSAWLESDRLLLRALIDDKLMAKGWY